MNTAAPNKSKSPSITYYGGIESDKKGVGLTGSCTYVEIPTGTSKPLRVIIDYGMFQGGKKDNEANKEVIDDTLIKADYLILTHAHADHASRIPYLVKNGFNGRIITTEITKELAILNWNDYIRIITDSIERIENNNTVTQKHFRNILSRKKQIENMRNNAGKKSRSRKGNNYRKTENRDTTIVEAEYQQICEELSKFGIERESDIKELRENPPELLFNEDDILKTIQLIKTLDVGEERKLIKSFYIDNIDDEIVKRIPVLLKEGKINKAIYVKPGLKDQIVTIWENELASNINKLKDNTEIEARNAAYKEKMLHYLHTVANMSGIDESNELYQEYTQTLKNEGIESEKDIILEPVYSLPYDKNDIKIFKEKLIINFDPEDQNFVKNIVLRFYNAGHIEGSVQALITLTNIRTKHILSERSRNIPFLNKEKLIAEKNLLFSGDLGRTRETNNAGKVEIPPVVIDYHQVESTYAGRNHPERKQSIQQLTEAINASPNNGKILIPAFSIQRTQDILLILLEEKLKIKEKIESLEKEMKQLDEANIERKNEITKELHTLHNKFYTSEILLDSPLSIQVNQVFMNKGLERYKLLHPRVQNDLFGKEMVRVLEKDERKSLYTDKNIGKNQIIVSSSGMCQGGAIMSHLINNISNIRSTIIFIGYTPDSTIGGKIKAGEDIKIDGNIYKVHCRVEDISGFSGHIGNDEILEDYVGECRYNGDTIIALNHGGPNRIELAQDIQQILQENNKRIGEILTPKLGQTKSL